MLDTIKGLWDRFEVHWHAVAAAAVAAIPNLLDKLGLIDLHSILDPFLGYDKTQLIVGVMPLVLLFLKPVFKVAPHPEDTNDAVAP